MADPKGFQKYKREVPQSRPVADRLHDYKEIYQKTEDGFIHTQAARCMDCGVPFCHNGCPLGNKMCIRDSIMIYILLKIWRSLFLT